MNKNRNTDQLFEHLRNAPVDVPLENVEKFVIAQAALGITAVGVSKGIFTKAFLKFHLNSILIMTTTATAALVSIFVWAFSGEKTSALNDSNHRSKFEYTTLQPVNETFEADSPKVKTVNTITNGEQSSVTTVQTETGTNIKIITLGNGETKVYYNTPNDSSYTFAYQNVDKRSVPAPPALPGLPALPGMSALAPLPPMPAMPPMGCCGYDSLTSLLGKELYKDGMIKDSTHFTFKMNGSSMFVDGKKQPKEKWEKYKTIIEKNSDYKIQHMFIFTTGMDGEDNSFGMYTPAMPMEPMELMAPMEPITVCNRKSCSDTLMTKLEHAMLQDGLIKDTMHYTFKINGSYLKVNGEKQSKEQWKKYKEIIERNSLNKVNRSFSYAISKDGEDTSINMENFID